MITRELAIKMLNSSTEPKSVFKLMKEVNEILKANDADKCL
jgi:hypothetical protein